MFSRISFCILLQITFLTMASQQNYAVLFTNIKEAEPSKMNNDNGMIMVIRCDPTSDLPSNTFEHIRFQQNPQKMLVARYFAEQQVLGLWPDRIIETDGACIKREERNDNHKETLKITIPYTPIIKNSE